MADVRYQNFDLTIQKEGKGYKIKVNSPAGEASGRFRVPFSDLELENFYLNTTPGKRSVRRIDTPEVASAKKYGERLFRAVFTEEVLGRLQSALNEADRSDERLRIRLRLTGVPELADLPWDYLYNPALNRFLALGNDTALVRYLELPERVRPVTVQLPLKMLVVISSPNDFPHLDVQQEWANLNEALGDLMARDMVSVDLMEDATMPELRRRLAKENYNILHFIGHGAFDRQTEEGVLVFKDENGRGRLVSGQQLGVLTHNHKSLALAVINACEGAKADATDVFAGTAQSLVQQGIPAVVAMQREITDDAAKVFAHAFYSSVAAGHPVEAAMTETRIALYAEQLGLEWATPVLYMRAQDGRVFDLQAPVSKPVQPVRPVEPPVTKSTVVEPVEPIVETVIEPPKREEVVAPLPVVREAAPAVKKEVPAVPGSGTEIARKITANTDEMLRSIAGNVTQKQEAMTADYVSVALEKAKRETEKENKKNNPRMNNMVLVALGLIGVVAVVVLLVFMLGNNGSSGNNNIGNQAGATATTQAEATATLSLPAGAQDLMATRTAVAGGNVGPAPTLSPFEMISEHSYATPLPTGAEADSMVFSEDGELLAVWYFVGSDSEGQNKGKILIWDLGGSDPIEEFDLVGYDRGDVHMAFFPSEGGDILNRKFAYMERQLRINIRHLSDSAYKKELDVEDVVSFGISFDGSFLTAGLISGEIVEWDMATMTKRFTVPGHSGRVQSVSFAPYSYVMATTDATNTRVWESGTDVVQYDVTHGMSGGDYGMKNFISHDSQSFSVCNWFGDCEFWTGDVGSSIGTLNVEKVDRQKAGKMLTASMTADDLGFVMGWEDGSVTYWAMSDLSSGTLLHKYSTVPDGSHLRVMAFSTAWQKMAIVTPDNKVQVWSLP